MTIVACNRHVRSGEGETGLLVLVERKAGDLESCTVMTLLASVPPGRSCELALMLVLVTINALCEFDLELRILAGGDVTRSAFNSCVRKRERETGLGVIGD